jgi:hypothetical protein
MDACCEVRRQLVERFATAARLYPEAVVVLTRRQMKSEDYERLLAATKEAQSRSEAAAVAFEEHVASHQCGTRKRADWNRGQAQRGTA